MHGFFGKTSLTWICSFTYQGEPRSSLRFTPSELSCLKIYFKRSLWLPFFCSVTSHNLRTASQTIFIHQGDNRKHNCFQVFNHCSCWYGWCFKPHSGNQCKTSVSLRLIVLPEEENRNSLLIYILKEIFCCHMKSR